MRTVLGTAFAPATYAAAFVEAPLAEVAGAFAEWRRGLGRVRVREVAGFPGALRELEPLIHPGITRELLVGTRTGWTAYFNNMLPSPDVVSATGHITRTMRRPGVTVMCAPRTAKQFGGVQFELLGPYGTPFLNTVRAIGVTEDDGRWEFDAHGTVQAFEETERYGARRVRDRFTPDMLERYCAALGIELFDESWYLSDGVLLDMGRGHRGARPMTFAEAQRWLGIEPARAAPPAG